MWDLPGPGIKLVSLALQGRFLTTGPPGKPLTFILGFKIFSHFPRKMSRIDRKLSYLWPSFRHVKNTIQATTFSPVLHLFLVSYHPIVPLLFIFLSKHDTRGNKYFTYICDHWCKILNTIGYRCCISVSAIINYISTSVSFLQPLNEFSEKVQAGHKYF